MLSVRNAYDRVGFCESGDIHSWMDVATRRPMLQGIVPQSAPHRELSSTRASCSSGSVESKQVGKATLQYPCTLFQSPPRPQENPPPTQQRVLSVHSMMYTCIGVVRSIAVRDVTCSVIRTRWLLYEGGRKLTQIVTTASEATISLAHR